MMDAVKSVVFAPASELEAAALAELFNRGYAGYFTPVALTADAMHAMVAAHGVDLARSRIARVDGTAEGIVLLAVRGDRGWIGGMGVARKARGRGLGRELMGEALASAREAGLASVALEVIEENRWAIEIYRDAGFEDMRQLEVWVRPAVPLAETLESEPGSPLPAAAPIAPEVWLGTLTARENSARPWQREPAGFSDLPGLAAYGTGSPPDAGTLIRVDGARAAILDLSAAPSAPPRALESALRAAIAAHPDATFMLLNLDAADPGREALAALGFEVRFRQREMHLRLD